MVNLTKAEEAELLIWQQELFNIIANNRNSRVFRKTPHLCVVETNPKCPLNVRSHGGKIQITRDCLQPAAIVPPAVRIYLIAHELGHEEGLHNWISGCIPIFVMLGSVAVSQGLASGSMVLGLIGLLLLCIGIAGAIAYQSTMLFEWDADRRAARLTNAQAILAGYIAIQPFRPNQAAYYLNKTDKINSKSPSIWKPKG